MPSNCKIPIFLRLSSGLVALAAVLVPDKSRAEWEEEWLAEMWCTYEASALQGPIEFGAKLRFVWRCFGAFADANALTVDDFVPSAKPGEGHELSNYARASFFGAYALLFLFTDLVARPTVLRRYGYVSIGYSYFYWASDMVLCLGAYLALFSVCRRTFGGSRRLWSYIRTLLIGSLIVAVALSAVQSSALPRILFFELEENVFLLLFAQSLLLCLFLARSGNSAGLKWLAFGLWLQMATPGLSVLLARFGMYSSSSFRYISWTSSYFVVGVWLYVIIIGRRRRRVSNSTDD
jgi:hypothetical protein